MKKTVKINISGVIFHLDEDAFQVLQNYLTAINQRFASNQEGKEIISDIEHRIAEILQSKLSEQKQVITKEDIDEVIEIMGRPEDFENEHEPNSNNYQHYETTTKRLYRNPDDRVLGGVCSGIATYLNIDPLILRILFFVLIFGFGIIVFIYIILWALLPEANTTAQKLEMRGENFNISDIEKNVRKEYENVKDNFKNFKNSEDYNRTKGFFESIIYAIGAFFKFILRFVVALFGLILVLAGVGFLLGLTGTLIIGEPFMPWNNIIIDDHIVVSDMIQSFMDPNTIWIVTICAILVVFIPLVAIIYGGLKLLLGLRPNDRSIAGIGFVAWLLSLIVLVVIIGSQAKDFSHSVINDDVLEIKEPANKTLYLQAKENNTVKTSKFYIFDGEFQVMFDEDDEKHLYAFPEIDIVYGYSNNIIIEIDKKGRGSNRKQAMENADRIEYHVTQQDSIILFDAVFSLMDKKSWRFPEVDITVKVPEGYILYLDKSIEEQLDYIDRERYYKTSEMTNKYWEMTENGLERYHKATSNDE